VTVTRLAVGQQPTASGPRRYEQVRDDRPPRDPPSKRLSRTARHAAAEDAKLLAALRLLFSNPSLYPRLLYLPVGFVAITALAFAYAEALPLPYGMQYVVLPAAGAIVLISLRHPGWGRRALLGWVAGVIATGVYDLLRLGLVWAGLWDDPIPGIGRLALSDPDASYLWGYLWRFAGNGGGMGMAFAMLPWRGVRSGIIYGTGIVSGLVVLLAVWPIAQVHFFPLTPATAAGGVAGHWVYGAVLGWLTARWLPPVGRRPGRRRRPAEVRHARQAPTLVAVPDAGGHGPPSTSPVQPVAGLTSDEVQAVKCALELSPRAHGFTTDRWTLNRVAYVVERVTGVACRQSSELRALLDAIGWRQATPRERPGPRAMVS
jgi:Winged helix-turn helix